MFTPDSRLSHVLKQQRKKEEIFEKEKERQDRKNKILVNHIVENFEKYFTLNHSQIGMFGRIEETWETIHAVDVVLPSYSEDAGGKIFSLFKLFTKEPNFESLFLEKLKFYGWNVKIPHRAGGTRVFLFHEPLKNILLRKLKKWFGSNKTKELPKPQNGPYRTLESTTNT